MKHDSSLTENTPEILFLKKCLSDPAGQFFPAADSTPPVADPTVP
jgi:hypothetical protein